MHLVRASNGLEAFEGFVQSYRRHPGGAPHELAVVLKGFAGESDAEPYRQVGADACDRWLHVPDEGFDLGAYRHAALALPHRTLVFVNSFSVITTDRWLEIMGAIARRSGVGAVGASGSWASPASLTRYALGLGGPYGRVFADRKAVDRAVQSLSSSTTSSKPGALDPIRNALFSAHTLMKYAAAYPSFPTPHLRTNSFMIDREIWLRACTRTPNDKQAAYRLEGGRSGMTARLEAMGLRVLVAGRDGRAYESSEWPASRTFWQGDQENLLVEDNQTRDYQLGERELRRVLSGYAWGAQANPSNTGDR